MPSAAAQSDAARPALASKTDGDDDSGDAPDAAASRRPALRGAAVPGRRRATGNVRRTAAPHALTADEDGRTAPASTVSPLVAAPAAHASESDADDSMFASDGDDALSDATTGAYDDDVARDGYHDDDVDWPARLLRGAA